MSNPQVIKAMASLKLAIHLARQIELDLAAGRLDLNKAENRLPEIYTQTRAAQFHFMTIERFPMPDRGQFYLVVVAELRQLLDETAYLIRDLNKDILSPKATRRLVHELEQIRTMAKRLYVVRQPEMDAPTLRLPRLLTMWATRILPAIHRDRYRDEFQGELWELRDQPGRRQLVHALRVLVRAVSLRRALRAAEPALEQQ